MHVAVVMNTRSTVSSGKVDTVVLGVGVTFLDAGVSFAGDGGVGCGWSIFDSGDLDVGHNVLTHID